MASMQDILKMGNGAAPVSSKPSWWSESNENPWIESFPAPTSSGSGGVQVGYRPENWGQTVAAPAATGPATRSPQGSYWQLPDGRYFVPQWETPGAGQSGGEGGIDTYGQGGWDDWVNVIKEGSHEADGKGYKAYGTDGTPYTFDNTGNVLPGYGYAPWQPSSGFKGLLNTVKESSRQQPWGQTRGTVYNAAPEEREFTIPKGYDFIGDTALPIIASAVVGGAAAGAWGGAGAMSGGGAGAAAGVGESVSGAYGATAGELAGYAGTYGADAVAGAGYGSWDVPGFTGGGESWGVNPRGTGMDYGGDFDFANWGDTPTMGGDEFGNFDMGSGTSGTDMFTGGDAAIAESPGFWDKAKSLFNQGKSASQIASALGLSEGAVGALVKAIPGLIGAFGANSQANTLQGIADRARADRQPFLDYSKSLLAGGPEAYGAGAGSSAVKGVLQGLSAKFGNPIGSGTALQLATDAGLRDWRGAVGEFANLGLGFQAGQAGLDTSAAKAGSGVWGALGGAAADVFAPKSELEEWWAKLNSSGRNTNLNSLG